MRIKNLLSLTAFAAVSLIMLNSYSGQAPAQGYTGSPTDGNNCTHCHTGTATPTAGMITTDIPSTGYEPGQTYDVTFTVSETGVSKFGFQVTSEDASGAKKGTFNATAATTAQNSGSHITHKSSSTAGTDMKAWTVTWTAPAVGTGTVTFYGAGNATNGQGNTSGDMVKTSSLSVDENAGTTGLVNLNNDESVRIYPLPAQDFLTLELTSDADFFIYDLNGSVHLQGNTLESNQVDVSNLNPGMYIIHLPDLGHSQRIVKL